MTWIKTLQQQLKDTKLKQRCNGYIHIQEYVRREAHPEIINQAWSSATATESTTTATGKTDVALPPVVLPPEDSAVCCVAFIPPVPAAACIKGTRSATHVHVSYYSSPNTSATIYTFYIRIHLTLIYILLLILI